MQQEQREQQQQQQPKQLVKRTSNLKRHKTSDKGEADPKSLTAGDFDGISGESMPVNVTPHESFPNPASFPVPTVPIVQAQPSSQPAAASTPSAAALPSPVPIAAVVATPVVPEEHANADPVESFIRTLKGTRPELLRTTTYYEGAKYLYGTLAGLPVLNSVAPTLESVTEQLINMTPLKPSSEEEEQRSVSVLDKKIADTLSYADELLDVKKDETIEGIVAAKKVVGSLGPVQSAVGAACNVGDGVGKAYVSANETVGGVWQQVWDSAANTYTEVTTMAGDTVTNVSNTAGSAATQVVTTTGNAVDAAKSTADSTVEGVKSMVNSTTSSVGSTWNWAVSNAVGIVGTVMTYPMGLVQTVLGSKKNEPAPEE